MVVNIEDATFISNNKVMHTIKQVIHLTVDKNKNNTTSPQETEEAAYSHNLDGSKAEKEKDNTMKE